MSHSYANPTWGDVGGRGQAARGESHRVQRCQGRPWGLIPAEKDRTELDCPSLHRYGPRTGRFLPTPPLLLCLQNEGLEPDDSAMLCFLDTVLICPGGVYLEHSEFTAMFHGSALLRTVPICEFSP